MFKIVSYIAIFMLVVQTLFGQQAPQYSQYTFNNFGHNPAFAGTAKCLDFKAGTRLQWVGFDNAPRTYFASAHMPFKSNHYKANKGTHAIGLYVEQDALHLTTRSYIKLGYAYHKKIFPKLTLGAGIFAGVQQYSMTDVFGNNNPDPVLDNAGGSVLHYPDIMPGILLYNNKVYYSFSINQTYFKNIKLGQESKQVNQYYIGMGHQSVHNDWTVFKSFLLKMNNMGPPALDLNIAWVYRQNFTMGIGYRAGEAIVAQIKFRVFDALTIGYAFDFPLNKIYGNYSHEIMLGFRQCPGGGIGEGGGMKSHTCPAYAM